MSGVGFFDDATFNNLDDGALKVGPGGVLTLTNKVQLYGNKQSDSKVGRNIICEGSVALPAQLLAYSSSFKEVGLNGKVGDISKNKWV